MDDSDLAKYPGLYARAGVWYVRKRVPVDLAHVEPRDQIRLSLETSDKRIAITRYPFKLAAIELVFENHRAELRKKGHVGAALTTGRLELLNRQEIEALAADWWRGRERIRTPQLREEDDPSDLIASIEDDAVRLASPLPTDLNPITLAADQLLVQAGMAAERRSVGEIQLSTRSPKVNRGSTQYAYLCDLVGRALRLEGPIAKDHVLRRRDAPWDPLFNPGGVHGAAGPSESSFGRTVADLIKQYREEREALFDKESTDRKYGLLFRVMEEVLGRGLPVSSIKRADCLRVLGFLKSLPPNTTKRFPKLTLSQAVEHGRATGLPGLAPGTVASYVNNLNAILRWAADNEWGVKVNTRGLVDTRHPKTKRRGFTPKELQVLFAGLLQFRDDDPTKFWVSALALFTGARANEICQLHVEDVVDIDGIRCLNLTVFNTNGERVEGKRVKTPSSERMVPLHPALIEGGFIEFLESRKSQKMLFPDLSPGRKNNYSRALGISACLRSRSIWRILAYRSAGSDA